MKESNYESDFYAWSNEQAQLIRSGRLSEADFEHIAEEIESMGKSELRTLENRLEILFLHLLKWWFQPERRGRSWQLSVREQRRKIKRHLKQNPSLRNKLPETMDDAYGDALISVTRETGLAEETFPSECPFSFDQSMDETYWPE